MGLNEIEMEVTNELLAAYAEGNVSDAERKAVREYLIKNPDELEAVLLLMDKDLELTPTDKPLADNIEATSNLESITDMCYSTAAFAPYSKPKSISRQLKPKLKKSSFKDRLNDLLDEMNL